MRPAVRADQPAVPQSPARGHEHELEPEFGLPEALPADERILWQGQPQAALVARRIFHLPALALYFGVMLAWRVAVQVHDGAAWHEALRGTVALALLAAVALTIVATLARLTASTTAYTLTNKRVVMRIGIVLTVTYNLPLRQIDGANLLPLKAGSGEISLALRGDTRIAVLHLWPHARPWFLRDPQPTLRCIPDVDQVAALIQSTWQTVNAGVPAVYGTASADAANDASAKPGQSNRPATA